MEWSSTSQLEKFGSMERVLRLALGKAVRRRRFFDELWLYKLWALPWNAVTDFSLSYSRLYFFFFFTLYRRQYFLEKLLVAVQKMWSDWVCVIFLPQENKEKLSMKI